MARKFTRISQDAFNEFAINSGMLLKTFDVSGGKDFTDEDIVCDTTGDITATCVPTYSDMGEDVNNCPDNMKELMHLDSWEAKLAFTALNVTPEVIRMALGAADVDGGKITPRMKLDTEKDFSDIWLVCDLLDDDRFVAVHLMNGLSTAGLSLKTTKNGKGQLQVEMSGHVSITAQDTVPMEFYVSEAA